jgi:deoxyribodipyrimidine photo-lyase
MSCALVWFRRDLRLADNRALSAALEHHDTVIPVYLHVAEEDNHWRPGAASSWWLHHSLVALDTDLRATGSRLVIREGNDHSALLDELLASTGATHVYWNRLYEPGAVQRDTGLKETLATRGVVAESHNAALLFEPWTILKADQTPYRVFTPYWKACLKTGIPDSLLPAPATLPAVDDSIASQTIDALQLLPALPWADRFPDYWTPGEAGAQTRLAAFLDDALPGYREQRDRPDTTGTSRLSPHLHFGEIGPRQIAAAINARSGHDNRTGMISGSECYLRELGWREFAHALLYHFPHTTDQPLDTRFQQFPWRDDAAEDLQRWQRGQTGIPIVDAGMRELWTTGWMHNRVRMIVASLLVKNLRIAWQAGADWFWDTLVDADLASNTLGWQWTAGCGADAAPYFRIFNPVTQAQKFDPDGHYIRRWVPEIAALPNRYLARPWEADANTLATAGIALGKDYPHPVVDLKASRQAALGSFQAMREIT